MSLKYNLFFNSQYGIRPKHSTEFAVTELIDRLGTFMDQNKIPFTILLILVKLLITLTIIFFFINLHAYYGIEGNALPLIWSYQ